MQRIEVSPLFKLAQSHDSKYINPLARIFKVTDSNILEQMLVPINSKHINRDRYERHEFQKSNVLLESGITFLMSPMPTHQKLAPELYKFDYVY